MRLILLLCLLVPVATHAQSLPSDAEVSAFAARSLEANCDSGAPGMAVLVARGDEVLYRGACGRASIELGVPLSPGHVFRIGSVTKQFAAAAVLKLAEDGRLSLDDPLSKFVPGYPGGEAVTVRMLLDHTSGIRSYTDIAAVMSGGGIMQDLSTARLIDSFRDQAPDFAPGTGWRYNNSGYVLVGAVIEAASGQSWHDYLRTAFFAPLGMDRTGYGNEAEAVIPGHVTGYTRKGAGWARAAYLSMTQPHAAGGLVSTLDDLHRWNRALHASGLLREAGYRAMVTPAGKAADHDYGFGITTGTLRGRPKLDHGGGIFGFSSYLLYLPEDELTVAVLYNADAGRDGMLGTGRIAQLLAAQAIGRPYPDKTPIEVEDATLREYAGVYRIDAGNTRIVRMSDGRLTSQRTGGQPYPLIPVAADTFAFEEGHSRIVFERDTAGRVAAMRFFPEGEGAGEVAPRSEEPVPAGRPEVQLPREALERIAGEYVHAGVVLRVFLDADVPKAQLTGQPAFEIFAESPSKFFYKVVEATLEFAPANAPARSVTLRQGGAVIEYVRQGD